MNVATIEKELRLSDTESLVLLRLEGEAPVQRYVTLVEHSSGAGILLRETERVSSGTGETTFALRTMFNGRKAYSVIDKDNRVTLDPASFAFHQSKLLPR